MCSRCSAWLEGLCLPHTIEVCPLRQAFYCPTCGIYGHEEGKCGVPMTVKKSGDEKKKAREMKEVGMFQKAKQQGRRLVFLPFQ